MCVCVSVKERVCTIIIYLFIYGNKLCKILCKNKTFKKLYLKKFKENIVPPLFSNWKALKKEGKILFKRFFFRWLDKSGSRPLGRYHENLLRVIVFNSYLLSQSFFQFVKEREIDAARVEKARSLHYYSFYFVNVLFKHFIVNIFATF